MHSAATECYLKRLRKSSVFVFMAVTNALSLPYHTNKNNFGLICWTRVFLLTSAPPILLIVHILMFKTLWSCSILDTASASRSLNYENEEKQHCFHQTAMLFSFYQLVLFPGFQMLKKKTKVAEFWLHMRTRKSARAEGFCCDSIQSKTYLKTSDSTVFIFLVISESF